MSKRTNQNSKGWMEDKTGEEQQCLRCCRKHLWSAKVLLSESCQGYPDNYFTALANLSLAADHVLKLEPGFAAFIRNFRLELEEDAAFRTKMPWGLIYVQMVRLFEKHGNRSYVEVRIRVGQRHNRS